ncbi:hypothetical protein [Mycolicibacterium mucogenicum]|uniref:hypothetical protein n=1 Tax=Mycolicibacterium mucogenicum TaxID=56689 RepID=UPI000A98097F|nr:hypothetical protein [Mycolicibacterium mucogenicum]
MSTIDQDALPHEKSTCMFCMVPTTGEQVCSFCASYVPPEPLTVNTLLAEADKLLPTLLASRLASASACFPAPDGGTVYVQSSGNRVNIAVTEKDPDTKQLVTREFTAVITEVTR